MRISNQKGFTLIELMISIIIIGLLTGIAIPKYNAIQIKAKESIQKTIGHNLQLAIEAYSMSAGNIPEVSTINGLIELLSQENYYTENTKNPFTNMAHSDQDASGQITYTYDPNTNNYTLQICGANNEEIMILSN